MKFFFKHNLENLSSYYDAQHSVEVKDTKSDVKVHFKCQCQFNNLCNDKCWCSANASAIIVPVLA